MAAEIENLAHVPELVGETSCNKLRLRVYMGTFRCGPPQGVHTGYQAYLWMSEKKVGTSSL